MDFFGVSKKLALGLLAFLPKTTNSQSNPNSWVSLQGRINGKDVGTAITFADDGSIISSGYHDRGYPNYDGEITVSNPEGQLTSNIQVAAGTSIFLQGNAWYNETVFSAGHVIKEGTTNGFLCGTTLNGTLLNSFELSGLPGATQFSGILASSDNTLVLAGKDAVVMSIYPNGTSKFRYQYPISDAVSLTAIVETDDKDYVTSGFISRSPSESFVAKIDNNGGLIWARELQSSINIKCQINSIHKKNDILFAVGNLDNNGVILQLNATTGSTLNVTTLEGSSTTSFFSGSFVDNQFVAAGFSLTSSPGSRGSIVFNGQDVKMLAGTQLDFFKAAATDTNGQFVSTGSTRSYNGDFNNDKFMTVKFGPDFTLDNSDIPSGLSFYSVTNDFTINYNAGIINNVITGSITPIDLTLTTNFTDITDEITVTHPLTTEFLSTNSPSSQPSGEPIGEPSGNPSGQPSSVPSTYPTGEPSGQPSVEPSSWPTSWPSAWPTSWPSAMPSGYPSAEPSSDPSAYPTFDPTAYPTFNPSGEPSGDPSGQPSSWPSAWPTSWPSTMPSGYPSAEPSSDPSGEPSGEPSGQPSSWPSAWPSSWPSGMPSGYPTCDPSSDPTGQPSADPSAYPTGEPSGQPSTEPSSWPTSWPNAWPTSWPSGMPSGYPTSDPSGQPSSVPSTYPTGEPSGQPSTEPSSWPTSWPSAWPTSWPSTMPSGYPSAEPSSDPSAYPTFDPTAYPTFNPSGEPSGDPSGQPSSWPSAWPTSWPSAMPSGYPSAEPSADPTSRPTVVGETHAPTVGIIPNWGNVWGVMGHGLSPIDVTQTADYVLGLVNLYSQDNSALMLFDKLDGVLSPYYLSWETTAAVAEGNNLYIAGKTENREPTLVKIDLEHHALSWGKRLSSSLYKIVDINIQDNGRLVTTIENRYNYQSTGSILIEEHDANSGLSLSNQAYVSDLFARPIKGMAFVGDHTYITGQYAVQSQYLTCILNTVTADFYRLSAGYPIANYLDRPLAITSGSNSLYLLTSSIRSVNFYYNLVRLNQVESTLSMAENWPMRTDVILNDIALMHVDNLEYLATCGQANARFFMLKLDAQGNKIAELNIFYGQKELTCASLTYTRHGVIATIRHYEGAHQVISTLFVDQSTFMPAQLPVGFEWAFNDAVTLSRSDLNLGIASTQKITQTPLAYELFSGNITSATDFIQFGLPVPSTPPTWKPSFRPSTPPSPAPSPNPSSSRPSFKPSSYRPTLLGDTNAPTQTDNPTGCPTSRPTYLRGAPSGQPTGQPAPAPTWKPSIAEKSLTPTRRLSPAPNTVSPSIKLSPMPTLAKPKEDIDQSYAINWNAVYMSIAGIVVVGCAAYKLGCFNRHRNKVSPSPTPQDLTLIDLTDMVMYEILNQELADAVSNLPLEDDAIILEEKSDQTEMVEIRRAARELIDSAIILHTFACSSSDKEEQEHVLESIEEGNLVSIFEELDPNNQQSEYRSASPVANLSNPNQDASDSDDSFNRFFRAEINAFNQQIPELSDSEEDSSNNSYGW